MTTEKQENKYHWLSIFKSLCNLYSGQKSPLPSMSITSIIDQTNEAYDDFIKKFHD